MCCLQFEIDENLVGHQIGVVVVVVVVGVGILKWVVGDLVSGEGVGSQ